MESGRWIGDPERLEPFYKDLAAGETGKWLRHAAEAGEGCERRVESRGMMYRHFEIGRHPLAPKPPVGVTGEKQK